MNSTSDISFDDRRKYFDEFDNKLNRSKNEVETLKIALEYFDKSFDLGMLAIGMPDYLDDSKIRMYVVDNRNKSKDLEDLVSGDNVTDSGKSINEKLISEDSIVSMSSKECLSSDDIEYFFEHGSNSIIQMQCFDNRNLVNCIMASCPAVVKESDKRFSDQDMDIFKRYAERVSSILNLQHKNILDSLTGLYVKGYGKSCLEHEYNRVERNNTEMSVLYVDLDHFKSVNDIGGHKYGDLMLKDIGDVIKANIRQYDIPVRDGGEEFMIVLPGVSLTDAVHRANELREKIYAKKALRPDGKFQTASIGVSAYPYVQGVSHLKEHADMALYCAKHLGRDQVCYSDGDNICDAYGNIIKKAPETPLRLVQQKIA